MTAPLPASIGRYRIEALIGKGGMGEVYRAFDPSLDRTVALKTIAPDANNPVFLDRLYREAKACGRLRHPHIVTVYDLGETDDVVFIAMEYLEGQNLAEALNRGDLSFEQKIRFLIQILEALQYAHSEGVVHRDVKPSNVLVLPDKKNVKLLDFGLAHVARAESLTMSGAIMGTPFYMSPEQLKGAQVDGRTDVYATGVVAYELLTRRRAFDGGNITTVMMKVLTEEPAPMATVWTNTFPELERIVRRAMAKELDARYSTAEDMRNALANFLASAHPAIANTQAEITVYAQRAVLEAKTLMADGKAEESDRLLAATLVTHPDAEEVRQLLNQRTEALMPPAPAPNPPPVAKTVAAPRAEAAPVRPVAAPRPEPPAAVAPPPAAAPPQAPVAVSPVQPPSRGASRWIGPIAAVLGVGIIALVVAQRGMAPGSGGPSVVNANPAESAQRQPVPGPTTTPQPQQPQQAAPANPITTAAPTTPGERPPQSATTPTQGPRESPQGTPQVGSQAGPPSGERAGARIPRSVFIDTSTDAALRAELVNALKARDLIVADGQRTAQFALSARVQVSVRPSPFSGTSGMTADAVGTVQLQNLTTGTRDTQSVNAHALEFGEAVVRQAALQRVAEQVSEMVDKVAGH